MKRGHPWLLFNTTLDVPVLNIVRDRAAHKPEAPAKDGDILRWRLRLVCGGITDRHLGHGFSLTSRFLIGLPSLSVKRRQPDQSTFSFTILKTIVLTPLSSVRFSVLS